MKAIALDIGNTQIKIGKFDSGQMLDLETVESLVEMKKVVDEFMPLHIISSSVAYSPSEQQDFLSNYRVLYLDAKTPVPVLNKYGTPHTLGLDRMAAVVGAQQMFQERDCLIIDVGTCITYDLLDSKSHYHGGGISPGVELRFKSMNDYTRNLPLITNYEEVPLIGGSTRESMMSGVFNGIAAEIDGIIDRYSQIYPDIQVILCGGWTKRFESKLKASIFASPELVLVGLIRILEYNEEKK
ncbi:type III pantothenate kinase [Reichenbachiella ulvae]|uniref:Type III pantothenate kinase n=1 Tax=Reichenbachiella ulvae TaxID=2980104 RepID=A0ABT3CX31_9BACT|nr:type III pantothenate kinase [Reichenbachiella ulvae]MCV9388162.1 type III pantothenate kinase [Reichenbachiella ulvae]